MNEKTNQWRFKQANEWRIKQINAKQEMYKLINEWMKYFQELFFIERGRNSRWKW